jgi:hypothetical protein
MRIQLTNALRNAANDAAMRNKHRHRSVPITDTITAVPGYPNKLVVFKIAASKFWQVRCWISGKTHRSSTRTVQLRAAQSYARQFYELLVVQYHVLAPDHTAPFAKTARVSVAHTAPVKPKHTFGALAAQMLANEQSRQQRGEFSLSGVQVMRNRLDAHILPRWAAQSPQSIDYAALLEFAQFLSTSMSSITVSQYLVIVRKILKHAVSTGVLANLPESPKIKVTTRSRGAFTPSEYWSIARTARKLRNVAHPDSTKLLRKTYKLRHADQCMPPDVAWVIVFMVNSFIRPGDLHKLQHKHVEIVRGKNTYLRLSLPETKKHDKPIVTLQPAVRIYEQVCRHYGALGLCSADDYLFLPHIRDRAYANTVLSFHFNWVLDVTGLKFGANDQPRSLYSLRHSAITFRLLYGQGIDLLTLARNARTSVDVINDHYASTVTGEQNIGLLQSRRSNHQH